MRHCSSRLEQAATLKKVSLRRHTECTLADPLVDNPFFRCSLKKTHPICRECEGSDRKPGTSWQGNIIL